MLSKFGYKKEDGTTVIKYAITSDFLDNEKRTNKEITDLKKQGLDTFFELYDDDDVKYFNGYFNSEYRDCEIEFSILNRFANSYGCTQMKIRDSKTGKMLYL
jgi:hypothetical protein